MSKLQLKKELQHLDAEKLRELILEVYSSRKEFKEYFDFYLNPDVEKLYHRYFDLMIKEFRRSKWSYSKARVSVLKKQLKEFESFSPGFYVINELRLETLAQILNVGSYLSLSETHYQFVVYNVEKFLELAEKNLQLDSEIIRLKDVLQLPGGDRKVKRLIKDTVQSYLEQHSM